MPGMYSEEYLNGKVPLIGCLESGLFGGLFVTSTRRIVSSLVVDEDEDDEFNRGVLRASLGIGGLTVFRDGRSNNRLQLK